MTESRATTTPLQLHYDGPDVEAGVIAVDFLVDALVGFSSAYAKLTREQLDTKHRIRVVGIEKGSTNILLDVWNYAMQSPAHAGVVLTGASIAGGVVYKGVELLAKLMGIKKHMHGARITNNNVTIKNSTVLLVNQTGATLPAWHRRSPPTPRTGARQSKNQPACNSRSPQVPSTLCIRSENSRDRPRTGKARPAF
jgi:hypothetical protein